MQTRAMSCVAAFKHRWGRGLCPSQHHTCPAVGPSPPACSLLASLGVANKASGEAAAAINWAVKDGAGRLGRFLFARW